MLSNKLLINILFKSKNHNNQDLKKVNNHTKPMLVKQEAASVWKFVNEFADVARRYPLRRRNGRGCRTPREIYNL